MKKILVNYYKPKFSDKWQKGSIFSAKVHEEIDNDRFQLYYSKLDSGWTEKVSGKKAGLLVNDGNGFTITIDNIKIRLDYCQANRLEMLLKLEAKKDRAYVHERIMISDAKEKSCKCGKGKK